MSDKEILLRQRAIKAFKKNLEILKIVHDSLVNSPFWKPEDEIFSQIKYLNDTYNGLSQEKLDLKIDEYIKTHSLNEFLDLNRRANTYVDMTMNNYKTKEMGRDAVPSFLNGVRNFFQKLFAPEVFKAKETKIKECLDIVKQHLDAKDEVAELTKIRYKPSEKKITLNKKEVLSSQLNQVIKNDPKVKIDNVSQVESKNVNKP